MANESPQAQAEVSESAKDAGQNAPDHSLNNLGKNETKTLEQRLEGASSPDEIAKIIAEASEGKFQEPATTEAEVPVETDPKTEPETPAETGETSEETEQATKEGATDGEKKTDEDDDEEGKLPNRIRTTDFSDVEKLALQLKRTAKRAGKDLTLAEAESRARLALGVEEPATNQAAKTAETPKDDGMPKSMDELSAKLKELVAKRTKAFEEDLDFKAANQLNLEIDALKEHRDTLRSKTEESAKTEQAAYDAAFDQAQGKASDLYDFVKQPESDAFKRMREIDSQLASAKDPLYNDPSKPLIIAQMVAKELTIAPRSANSKPAVRPVLTEKQQPTAPPKKGVPPVASGASRTSNNTQGAALSAKIDSLRTPEDIEKFLAAAGG